MKTIILAKGLIVRRYVGFPAISIAIAAMLGAAGGVWLAVLALGPESETTLTLALAALSCALVSVGIMVYLWCWTLGLPFAVRLCPDGALALHSPLRVTAIPLADVTRVTETSVTLGVFPALMLRHAGGKAHIVGFPETLAKVVRMVRSANPEAEFGPWKKLSGAMETTKR